MHQTFSLDSAYLGQKRQVKQRIVEMTLNGSGVSDIARVLHINPAKVIQVFKKNYASKTSQSETFIAVETRGSKG